MLDDGPRTLTLFLVEVQVRGCADVQLDDHLKERVLKRGICVGRLQFGGCIECLVAERRGLRVSKQDGMVSSSSPTFLSLVKVNPPIPTQF